MSQVASRGVRPRGLRLALLQFGAAAALLVVLESALLLDSTAAPVWALLMFPLVAVVYLAFGLLAWHRQPSNQMGMLLCLGGLTWLAAGLGNSGLRLVVPLGLVLATASLAVVIQLLLAFPSGRLTSPRTVTLVAAAYGVAIVAQAPSYLFATGTPPFDILHVADRPELVVVGAQIQRIAGFVVVAATAVALIRRLRRAPSTQRRVLAPLYAYGVAVVLAVPLIPLVPAPLFAWSGTVVFVVQATLVGLVPVAFGSSILLGGFARTAEIEELGAWLGSSGGGRASLRDALARTLGDTSLELAFWLPGRGGYVDADGRQVPFPVRGRRRRAVEVKRAGQRVGAISYDPAVLPDADLVRAAGRVVAIAVDNERLTAELRANQDDLRQSRRRIVEAGDRERRRIERNLHDGAQQRMMSVALALRLADSGAAASPELRALLAEAAGDLAAAVRELRELARGVHPSLLAEVGLAGALESLAERSTVPVRLWVRIEDRVPEPVMVGAYYVVAEALTNAAKHSGAGQVVVDVATYSGLLRVAVSDDGIGGARAEPGSGLEGLTDRVDSLGGRLQIASAPGVGTRLVADLPCG